MKTVKLKLKDVGRYGRVLYDDSGACDGILTRVDEDCYFRFLSLRDSSNGDQGNNGAPPIKLGNYISGVDSGLN